MKYAPVIIPTLNRFEHFKHCLESLESCTGAEFTDVYVALDYPPSEKYVEGWKKNNEYLRIKEKNNGFKSLVVYRRKENYFFSGKGNAETAIKDLPPSVDSYIFTEDDNVFSPNFLDYINKGLEKYCDDDSVYAICGYSHIFKKHNTRSNFYRQNVYFSAWGYGITFKQNKDMLSKLSKSYFVKKLFSPLAWYRIIKSGPRNFEQFISSCKHYNGAITDVIISIYMSLENKNVIMPNVSSVRNMGFDGTGEHCHGYEYSEMISNQEIQDQGIFTFLGDGLDGYKKNHYSIIYEGICPVTWSDTIKNLLKRICKCELR